MEKALTTQKISIAKPVTKRKHSYAFGLYLCLFGYIAFNYILKLNGYSESIITIVLQLLLLVFTFFKSNIIKAKKPLLWLFYVMLSLGLSFLAHFTLLGAVCTICLIILFLYITQKYPLKTSEVKILFWLFCLFAVFVFFNTGTLTAGWENKLNPNIGGFVFTMLACISFVLFLQYKKIYYLIIFAVSFAMQFYFGSRTALLGLGIFVFACIILRAYKKTKTFKPQTVFVTLLVFAALGVLLAYVYSEILFPLIGKGNVKIFGKDLFTGRQVIWNDAFESIKQNLLFGVGDAFNVEKAKRLNDLVFTNIHNQPLAVIVHLGIIVFVVFYAVFGMFVARLYNKNGKARYLRYPALFLGMITIMSYFEMHLFSQYTWAVIFLVYAMISAISKEERKTVNQNNYYINQSFKE